MRRGCVAQHRDRCRKVACQGCGELRNSTPIACDPTQCHGHNPRLGAALPAHPLGFFPDNSQKRGPVSSRPLFAPLPLLGTYKQVMSVKCCMRLGEPGGMEPCAPGVSPMGSREIRGPAGGMQQPTPNSPPGSSALLSSGCSWD